MAMAYDTVVGYWHEFLDRVGAKWDGPEPLILGSPFGSVTCHPSIQTTGPAAEHLHNLVFSPLMELGARIVEQRWPKCPTSTPCKPFGLMDAVYAWLGDVPGKADLVTPRLAQLLEKYTAFLLAQAGGDLRKRMQLREDAKARKPKLHNVVQGVANAILSEYGVHAVATAQTGDVDVDPLFSGIPCTLVPHGGGTYVELPGVIGAVTSDLKLVGEVQATVGAAMVVPLLRAMADVAWFAGTRIGANVPLVCVGGVAERYDYFAQLFRRSPLVQNPSTEFVSAPTLTLPDGSSPWTTYTVFREYAEKSGGTFMPTQALFNGKDTVFAPPTVAWACPSIGYVEARERARALMEDGRKPGCLHGLLWGEE